MPVRVFGILLLQVSGIRQEDFAKIGRRIGTEDGSRETAHNQQRKVARMVKVSMGKDDSLDAPWLDRKRRPIFQAQRFETLK